jgi:NAD(P)-dependent dehydrogenase (short-subunit alcohol dehydrogenase family)
MTENQHSGQTMKCSQRVCFIAGASGAIGMAVAKRFHEEGFRLALGYNTFKPDVKELVEPGADIRFIHFDIARRKEVQRAVEEIFARFGSLDCLVNCIGILGPIGPTSSVQPDEWVRAIEINLIGSFYLTQAVLPGMLAKSYGKIIHFSGGGAAYGRPFYTAYSASKAALVRFCESLAEEVRSSHIDINAIAPGPVHSRMWEQVRAWDRPDEKTQAELAKMDATGGIPPNRAAELALFLASGRSDGLSGRLISAVWDNWEALESSIPNLARSEGGTLRRVPLA